MKLHHLRNVVAIVERGSLRAAAKHLGLAQPAMSRSVRELESELGVVLFERNKFGMTLTTVGEIFVRRAKAMGLHVVVADGNPTAPAFAFADAACVVSTYDEEGMAEAAAVFNAGERRVDGVFSASADVPRTVARVAERLNLPGISRATAALAADAVRLALARALARAYLTADSVVG